MNEIKIYSPVNGKISLVEKSSDNVFAQKILGDGFVIIPSSDEFFSPFEESVLEMVFDTKHAFFIKQGDNGPKVLIHIGLNTVNLEGKPFEVIYKQGQKLNINEPFVKVNLDMIKEHNISIETPIVFDSNENINWKFEAYIKEGEVKKGDLIGIMKYNLENNIKENLELLNTKGKFETYAEQIYELVGTASNFNKHYNCMTRLRFDIVDKNFVKDDNLKKLSFVKGLNWNGSELQVIIGGDCYKVKEAVDKIVESKNIKKIGKTNYVKKKF